MNYLSLNFLIFYFFVYIAYWNIPNNRKRLFLLLASAVFYAFFSLNFLLHLLLVISANYLLYFALFKSRHYLKFVIILNILNLAFFKYFYFLMELVGQIAGIKQLQVKTELNQYFSSLLHISGFEIVLPLTISYYTFQMISIAVDSKKETVNEKLSLFDFASFVLFFPVMLAGPILRYKQISEQFARPVMTEDDMNRGLWLVIRGIFKKAILSDYLASSIYPVFGSPGNYSGISLLLTSYFFALHLYLDFSGLTDLARGIARLLGFQLPENFKAPFFMNSFGDFWRRWHLTFSFWIRDYIYIPLGGSRKGDVRNFLNLVITFALGGIWHGASLNFLLWGVLTGFYLSLERVFEKTPLVQIDNLWKKSIHYILILHIYFISWILFFTPDVSSAAEIFMSIITFKPGLDVATETGVYALVFTFLFHLGEENPEKFHWFEKIRFKALPVAGVIIVLMMIQAGNRNIDFFYSQF